MQLLGVAAQRRAEDAVRVRGEGEAGFQGHRSVPQLRAPVSGSVPHALDDAVYDHHNDHHEQRSVVRYRSRAVNITAKADAPPPSGPFDRARCARSRAARATLPHTALLAREPRHSRVIAFELDIARILRVASDPNRARRLQREDRDPRRFRPHVRRATQAERGPIAIPGAAITAPAIITTDTTPAERKTRTVRVRCSGRLVEFTH